MIRVVRKPVMGVCDHVRHYSRCATTEDKGLKFQIFEVEVLYYLCGENKGPDQLRISGSLFSQMQKAYSLMMRLICQFVLPLPILQCFTVVKFITSVGKKRVNFSDVSITVMKNKSKAITISLYLNVLAFIC